MITELQIKFVELVLFVGYPLCALGTLGGLSAKAVRRFRTRTSGGLGSVGSRVAVAVAAWVLTTLFLLTFWGLVGYWVTTAKSYGTHRERVAPIWLILVTVIGAAGYVALNLRISTATLGGRSQSERAT